MNTAQGLFQTLVMVAGSTVVAQAIIAFLQRRKVSAETTDVLSDTALAQLASMRTDLDKAMETQRKFRQALFEHEKWDRMVVRRLDSLGVSDVPPPPDLWI